MNEWWGVVVAALSAVATCLAVVVTWRAPIAAAQLAERLRREAAQNETKQTQKLQLFSTLMQERAAIYSEAGVRALNLIDVVSMIATRCARPGPTCSIPLIRSTGCRSMPRRNDCVRSWR
jgi:hypothetical protein